MTAEPCYIPPSYRLHFGRILAKDIDAGYRGSADIFDLERYELYSDAKPTARPDVFVVVFDLWDKRYPAVDRRHNVHPRDYDLVLYGAADVPIPLDDVGRLVDTTPFLGPEWRLLCSLDVLRSLSCTLNIHRGRETLRSRTP